MVRLSLAAILILWLIVLRSLGEVFRLQYVQGSDITLAQVTPYVGSALLTTAVLGVALACHLTARYRAVIAMSAVTVAGLLIYKIEVLG